METQIAVLKEIVQQHSIEIGKLFEINSKLNGAYYKDNTEHLLIKNQMESIHEKLDTIIIKVDHTNGTVRLHTKILLIVGTAVSVLMATNGSSLLNFFLTIVK